MSILIGVTHMNLGILMSLYNNNYFRDSLSTWCEFVPQMIFLNSLFGYLSFLIVYKWATGMTTDLYHVLIYMFLKPGEIDAAGYAFNGQAAVQNTLLALAFIAVPWMLLPKPLILKARNDAARRDGSGYQHFRDEESHEAGTSSSAGHGGGGGHGGHGEEFEFGEVMVHQMIHAIEFVLGAVSNTASYLRLWALSLAHSQLSAVFYDRVLMAGIASGSPTAMVVAFFVWALATLGVLMVMESLSAFLHALRLVCSLDRVASPMPSSFDQTLSDAFDSSLSLSCVYISTGSSSRTSFTRGRAGSSSRSALQRLSMRTLSLIELVAR